MEKTSKKGLHTKLTLEKKILPPPLPGFELATLRWRVRRSTNKLPGLSNLPNPKEYCAVCKATYKNTAQFAKLPTRLLRTFQSEGSDPHSDTVVRPRDKTYSCYGSRQTLTSPSDSVWCLMKTAHARFLSHMTRCPIATSKPVCRTTVPNSGSVSLPTGLLCSLRSAHLRLVSQSVSQSIS